ncbi:MAG: glutamyl-tRNA reductase [Acidimicrobiia bacterium]|nr:glutamyl-tRNA reductase [Acidimicrobiia bacterium]
MTVVAIGLNHRTTPLATLEDLIVAADEIPKALAEVSRSDVVTEAVVISTCNRTEFYVHAERFHDGFRDVREAIALLSGLAPERFDPYLYAHYHDDAARHLFHVTAGLDSVVVGEHEILGQAARAWEQARLEGAAGPVLNLLFQRAIESGKKVRTDTDIGRSTASLSHAAVALVEERRGTLDGASVLLVGAGELGASVATALCRKHRVSLVATNRTDAKAATVAAQLGGTAVPFASLAAALDGIDIVISATGAPGAVIPLEAIESAAADRDLLLLDLAIPRDVPAEAADVDRVQLVELDELQGYANRGLERRRAHVEAARAVVEAELDRYRAASSAREMAPLIGGLHAWADSIRTGELERYAHRLQAMPAEDREAIEALSRSIVAKMLHQPTVSVKGAAGTAKGDRLADAVRELFDLS